MSTLVFLAMLILSHHAVDSHIVAWAPGMYCRNGADGTDTQNTDNAVSPLYQLSRKDWWMHHINGCDQAPPPAGEFLNLPDGGSFTVELAGNKGQTSLAYQGRFASDWPDGNNHDFDLSEDCITSPNLHAQNKSMAAGTAFAISYTSDLSKVAEDNLIVFSVRHHTPWKRVTTYDVPSGMPPCPSGGCICAWGWVPNHCGISNMYMLPYRCMVTNPTGKGAITRASAPTWCVENGANCISGPKQMIYWNQLEGNNVNTDGKYVEGVPLSPGYNDMWGFTDGAQNDILTSSPRKALRWGRGIGN